MGKKNGKAHFGYRLHVGLDEGSGLLRTAAETSARVQDVAIVPAPVAGTADLIACATAYNLRRATIIAGC